MATLPRLLQPKAPRLPAAGRDYDLLAQDQLLNALRIYFNQLDGMSGALLGRNGGQFVDCPNGVFFDVEPQTVSTADTATPVLLRQTYLSNGVHVNAGTDSRVYTDVGGVYNFQFSGQLASSSSSSKAVYLWIVRNGVAVGYSTHAYTISGSGTQLEVSWNFNIDMQPGDYIELEWAASDINVTLAATAATAPHPGIPSAVMAVNFVAPLPETLPIPP